jgi:alpha-glucosidase (family GH31 glycosyl hydrolase)
MKGIVLSLILLFPLRATSQPVNNPISNASAMVIDNNVRFTILTSGLVRMEWDSLGRFEDQASFVVINRNLKVPEFRKKESGGWLIITTDKLVLKYKKGSGKFTANNLQVSFLDKNLKTVWKPGMANNGNLKGTYRTLDRCDGNLHQNNQGVYEPITLEDGLISRDGWFVWDDSKNFLFDNSDWKWVQPRPSENSQDWYFFGYGNNYKSALYDYTQIAGKIPMPPRFAFGYWWSRYWNYSDQELRDLIADMDRNQIPHDVLVIDMDWHVSGSPNAWIKRDEFGERIGWTGYTWNKNLFPDPEKFLAWTNNMKLKTTLNLHPASGIAPDEEKYPEFAKAMNFDTTGHHNIPFECADKDFMENLFNIVLHPYQDMGVDFWWLDWQQWQFSKKISGLSNTWWLNYCFFTDMERNSNQRPMLYHRWGGMGNHRYQIGFSGDTKISWKSLDYQPYFTATASNVGYGYWSHDIGGHMILDNDTLDAKNPELFTRWLQFATFSPIFRTHSTKDSRIKKEMWIYPLAYRNPMYEAVDIRYELAPYIYTMARKTFDTGISICHPLYYDYPDKQEAYDFKNEYFFGDDMIVMPVTSPETDNFATVKVWLPEGSWYEWFTGTILKGGQIYERKFLINEIPVYIKAGAIIPMFPKIMNLQQIPDNLILRVFPGESFETSLYEDNGDDKEYTKGAYAFTRIKSEKMPDGSLKLIVYPRDGKFKDMNDSRNYEFQIYGSLPAKTILVNNKNFPYSYDKVENTWNYSGKDLTIHVYIPKTNCSDTIVMTVVYPPEPAGKTDIINGVIDKMNRLRLCVALLKENGRVPASLSDADITNLKLEYNPMNSIPEIEKFNANFSILPNDIKSLKMNEEIRKKVLNYFK